jgi:ethylmalonyl-CoA mutase
MDGLVSELVDGAREEMAAVAQHGGAVEAVPYMKTQLVESHRARLHRIEGGELKVVGQNVYTEAEPSPLYSPDTSAILRVDPAVESSAIAAVTAWRNDRNQGEVDAALAALREAAADETVNLMPPTLAAASAGVTTGEWAEALRSVFGEYRAPTGVADAAAAPGDDALASLRDRVERVSEALGRRVKILVGKPGLDGHSNGAEQIAVRARDAGMDVVYEGIRLTPSRIARTAVDEGVHVVGLSILSGSHAELIPAVLSELADAGANVPVVVGGIIPPADETALLEAGVARVYTPKDFEVSRIMGDIVDLVAEHHGVAAVS